MKTFQDIQQEIGSWAKLQFGRNVSLDTDKYHYGDCLDEICSFYGMISELGELAALDVRAMQGRNKLHTALERKEAREDALADCLVFMCDYASRTGIDLNVVLDRVWAKVRQRNQKTWEQDKTKEKPELTVGGVEHEQRVEKEQGTPEIARTGDATGNFGAGCEEGHHETVDQMVCGRMTPVCKNCKIIVE